MAYTAVDIFRIIQFPIFFPREVENRIAHLAVLTSRLGRFCFFSPFFSLFFLQRLCLNGSSGQEIIISTWLETVEALAFEPLSQLLYWVNAGIPKIEVRSHHLCCRGDCPNVPLGSQCWLPTCAPLPLYWVHRASQNHFCWKKSSGSLSLTISLTY